MNITESIKFDKLKEENQELKNQLAKKDKEIEWLQNNWINKQDEFTKLKSQQLYKEDFYKNPYSTGSIDWILVDSSKYDKLPSKEDKTCI